MRPIGLYLMLHRLWSRARRPAVRQWALALRERLAATRIVSTEVGKQPLDAVWRASARVAVERVKGRVTVAVNGDITRCFDGVDWALARRSAPAVEYPTSILRLSLAAHAWQRIVSLSRACAAPILASK